MVFPILELFDARIVQLGLSFNIWWLETLKKEFDVILCGYSHETAQRAKFSPK